MARTKSRPGPSITTADTSSLAMPVSATQDQHEEDEEEDLDGNSDQSDIDPPPTPPVSKKSKPVAKRKPRKSPPAKSIPTSPIVTSSPATTPQPVPGRRRKGGNKRKWTHEYCLTCTRYGRACGGRREGEEGCAVCRDPDRSKGEKLRECLWADHEAGITDYETARAIFKKAQAEARALRARSKRRQPSNAPAAVTTPRNTATEPSIPPSTEASAVVVLPLTTRPLDLQPPSLGRPGYLTRHTDVPHLDNGDTVNINGSHFTVHHAVANPTDVHHPRIHRPQLIYVAIDSDNEERAFTAGQTFRPGTISQEYHQGAPMSRSDKNLVSYYDAEHKTWIKPSTARTGPRNTSLYYPHPYRSAYDAPPAPPSHLIRREDDRQINTHRMGSTDAPRLGTPSSTSLSNTDTLSRKWAAEGAKIRSFSGYDWKTSGWKPSPSPKIEEATGMTNLIEGRAVLAKGVDDSSSLSSYVSIDEDDIDGVVTDQVPNGGDIDSPTSHLKRKFDDTAMESARRVTESNSADDAVLHINLGSAITSVPANASRTHDKKRVTTFQQRVAVSFPGEITIQEDEEAGTSSSDSELTSDEGKLKSLPSKLRGLLSRNRITKVIIGEDIFEIRPRIKAASSKMHKRVASADIRGKGRKQARTSIVGTPTVDFEDESDAEDTISLRKSAQARDEDANANRPPIKIKLIFKPKMAIDSRNSLEATSKVGVAGREAVDTSTLDEDAEMDQS